MTRRQSPRGRLVDFVRTLPAVALGFAIFWGLLRIDPTTPPECIAVTVAGQRTVWGGRSGWQHTFIVVADTGASAQVWSEPVVAPFDTTYRGPALLSIRHGTWFGDHTTLGLRCVAPALTTAPLRRDPHRPAGYLRADLVGAPGLRLFLLTALIEIAVLLEGWRLWSQRRLARARQARARSRAYTSSAVHDSSVRLSDRGSPT